MYHISPQIADQIVIDHTQNHLGRTALSKKYGYAGANIAKLLHKRGVYHYVRKDAFAQLYSCDDNFFADIDHEHKAYWLGFIAADGSVSNKRLSIFLREGDKDHLDLFRQHIKSNGRILPITKKAGGVVLKGGKNEFYPQCYLGICSRKLIADLALLGIVRNKIKRTMIPAIPESMIPHFIRGLLDGDGWLSIRTKDNQKEMGFLGSHSILMGVRKILARECKVSSPRIRPAGETWKLRYTGNKQVPRIEEYLYKNATAYLKRKHHP